MYKITQVWALILCYIICVFFFAKTSHENEHVVTSSVVLVGLRRIMYSPSSLSWHKTLLLVFSTSAGRKGKIYEYKALKYNLLGFDCREGAIISIYMSTYTYVYRFSL